SAVAAILIVSARAIWVQRLRAREPDPVLTIMFICVIYALVLPRLKLYSYVIVIPPAMLLARRARDWIGAAIVAICLIPNRNLAYPNPAVPHAISSVYDAAHIPPLIFNYTSLFALFAIWLWYVFELQRDTCSDGKI